MTAVAGETLARSRRVSHGQLSFAERHQSLGDGGLNLSWRDLGGQALCRRLNQADRTLMQIALTRGVSPLLNNCTLTHLAREPIDVELAREQHGAYEECLREFGYEVRRLPAAPHLPDSVFVEDTVVVLDELAVITRPGAPARRPETASMKEAVEPFRRLHAIEEPAVLDGGDVLRIGRRIYVGLSGRSDRAAIKQLREILEPYGYAVEGVSLRGCLHLKSAITQVADDVVLMNPEWVSSQAFPNLRHIEVDPAEPQAANALLVGDTVLFPAQYRRTAERLRQQGIAVRTVDVSELGKAEGGVTCCSVILEQQT